MRVVIIGGTGHIGTYLVPRLVRAGHSVVCISRGRRRPYRESAEWQGVELVAADRAAEDRAGAFGRRVAGLRPDAVVDLVCFTPESARLIAEALRGQVRQFLHCGTIWVHGEAEAVPTPESARRRPIGEYGVNKNAIEEYLLDEAHRRGFPAAVIHPGHIVGPGWNILNPQGNFNPAVFRTIAEGGELELPNLGLECVHHVHADDVAQCFQRAMERPGAAAGESFHAVSPAAVTLLGYARAAYAWFGREPRLAFLPLAELSRKLSSEDAEQTFEHVRRSPCMSIAKARSLLGYEPRYTSLEACREAAAWIASRDNLPMVG
jgi:nucleoside-diphosphate-sugar epimerase